MTQDTVNKRSGAVRLAYAMRYMRFKFVRKKHVFANNFHAFSAYLPNKYVHLCTNRQTKFEGVSKSPVVGYNDAKQRIRYLAIGWPPSGENAGNTAENTHRLLQIVKKSDEREGQPQRRRMEICINGKYLFRHAHSICACTSHMRIHIPYTHAHAHSTCAYTSHIHMHIPHAHAHAHSTCACINYTCPPHSIFAQEDVVACRHSVGFWGGRFLEISSCRMWFSLLVVENA